MTVNPYRPQPNRDPILAPSRIRTWRVEVLDRDERTIGFTGMASRDEQSGVTGWDVEANDNSRVGLSGTLRVRGDLKVGGIQVDYSLHRFRIWESVEGVGEWPLGILVPALPSPQHSWRDTEWEVPLLGKLYDIQQYSALRQYVATIGSEVTYQIAYVLINDVGERAAAVTNSTAKLKSPIYWPSGTSMLTLLNELAGAIGYRGLVMGPMGIVRSSPYVLPKDRPLARTFAADAASLLTPEWSEEWNLAEVPNVYLARSSEVDGVVMEAVAEDRNPEHPTSIPRRGGTRVVEVEEGVEVATQAALQAHANRRLAELTAPSQRVQVTHLTVPTTHLNGGRGVWAGDRVTHRRPGHNIDAVVERMAWSSESQLCAATWRKI